MPTYASIDEYVASLPDEVRGVLEEIRRRVHLLAPGAGETISYQMPTFTLGGRSLVHVAGWKHHVSLYPVPDAVGTALEQTLAAHVSGKGTVRFSLREPIPYELIDQVVLLLIDQAATPHR